MALHLLLLSPMNKTAYVSRDLLTSIPTLQQAIQSEFSRVCVLDDLSGIVNIPPSHDIAIFLDFFRGPKPGVEICRELRNKNKNVYKNIILITDESSERIQKQAYDSGCEIFFSLTELSDRLPMFLRWRSSLDGEFKNERFDRHSIKQNASLSIGVFHLSTVILNASASGVLLQSAQRLELGDIGVLRYTNQKNETIEVRVEIVRCERSRSALNPVFEVGAKFLSVDFLSKSILQN